MPDVQRAPTPRGPAAGGRGTTKPRSKPKSAWQQHQQQHQQQQQPQQRAPNQQLASSLRATRVVTTSARAALPAELLEHILAHLPAADLARCARASRRLHEMVYDDSRWVKMLRRMGCWDEGEARRRAEDAVRRRLGPAAGAGMGGMAGGADAAYPARGGGGGLHGSGGDGGGAGDGGGGGSAAGRGPPGANSTLFDAGFEEQKVQQRQSAERDRAAEAARARKGSITDGFEAINLAGADGPTQPAQGAQPAYRDTQYVLQALSKVRSIRGGARQEYGKVYAALAPYYFDIVKAESHADPMVFRTFVDPEQQAQVLVQIKAFSKSDAADGWPSRVERLESMIGVFENAVLREFEQGYEAHDYDGRMRRYASVLCTLGEAAAGIDIFIHNHPLMRNKERLGDPLDCVREAPVGGISPGPSYEFFRELSLRMEQQSAVIDRVFPPKVDVLLPFVERLTEDVLSEYITGALDYAHAQNMESYLKLTAALFEQSLQFAGNIKPTAASQPDVHEKVKEVVIHCFDAHVDLYLNEELALFTKNSDAEVTAWEKRLQDEAASAELFFMSNVQRQAAKNDFLSSFKKVVMMPVTVLPSISNPFPFVATNRTPSSGNTTTTALANGGSLEPTASRSSTPVGGIGRTSPRPGSIAPTSELAAKAAIMSSRLAGISGLFSIEMALNLTHAAKASLDRTALLVKMGGQAGEEAREQCESIFVNLLQILGTRHVKTGFDKAVTHLSEYDPRAVAEHNKEDGTVKGVEPLVTFLELVNVGDLIMQMVDVFFLQELAANKLVDRDDFLSPAVKEKKRFEQMLDERVAAGLSKGIDVLIDEVEFICSTTQPPGASTFNPGAAAAANGAKGEALDFDIGPTPTAKKIVDMVSSHTSMLVGSTDKNVLDVFNQEVGVRLFTSLCKHLKRQRVSMDGAMKLISDTNHYHSYVVTLKNKALTPYFAALRELAQIYLVDAKHYPKELASIIADQDKYYGIFRAEEVLEFAERRADWFEVRYAVERAMFGLGCTTM